MFTKDTTIYHHAIDMSNADEKLIPHNRICDSIAELETC